MKWLLLRGLVREQRHWGEFPEIFRAQLSASGAEARVENFKAEVFCLDLPGTGTECRIDSPWSVDGIVEEVRRRWLRLTGGKREEWSLLGISLGGMVAMHWCATYPEDFKNLVLVNSSAANLSAPWRRLRLRTLPRALQAELSRDPFRKELGILKLTTRLHPEFKEIARKWVSFSDEFPVKRGTGLRQICAALSFKAPPEIIAKTLVVLSAEDEFTDPRCSLSLAKRLCAPTSLHPRAGHDLPLDDPKWLAREISEWVFNPTQSSGHSDLVMTLMDS